MSRVWHIATKELLQNRRDPLALLFTIVLPLVFTVFLGLLIPTGEDEGSLPLAVADADGTPVAAELVQQLEASSLLELEAMPASEIDSAVQDQKVAAGLVIPEGFGSAMESGHPVALTFVRVQTSTGAQSVWQAVESILSESNTRSAAATAAAEQLAAATGDSVDGDLLESARSAVDAQMATPVIQVTMKDDGGSATSEAGGFNQSSTGSLVNWVLFGLLGVSSTVVLERRLGLFRRLSATGVRARQIIGGKMLAMVILTFLQQLLLILVGQFAFGVDYFNSPVALLVTMISLSVMAAAFGLLIASVFHTEQAVVATTVITALLLAALGGAWFPLEVTSAGFSKVAHVLPSAWVMDALHGITLKGWGLAEIAGPLGVVWIWIVALFAVAVWRFRPN